MQVIEQTLLTKATKDKPAVCKFYGLDECGTYVSGYKKGSTHEAIQHHGLYLSEAQERYENL